MLNGTLIAIQRAMTCLLENNFDSEKKVIEIPPALAHYMGENRLNLGD